MISKFDNLILLDEMKIKKEGILKEQGEPVNQN